MLTRRFLGIIVFSACFVAEVAIYAAPSSVSPVAFDPQMAAPYFTTPPASEARRHFQMNNWKEAAAGFNAYVRQNPRSSDRWEASFLAAVAELRAGNFGEAARHFDRLVQEFPLLADYHRFYAARAYLALKQWRTVLARAQDIPRGSPLEAEAMLTRADAWRQLGTLKEAERELRDYIARFPESWRAPEARFYLAEVVAAAPSRWLEARPFYLALYLDQPAENWGKLAHERLAKRDPVALTLSGPQHLERGLALFEAMRNAESEAEFKAALAVGDLNARERCSASYNLAQSVFKARDRARAAAFFDAAALVCAESGTGDAMSVDLHMKSLYQGGRCHAARGEPEIAAQLFARAEAEHPTHSFADDARVRQAEIFAGMAEKARQARLAGRDGGSPEEADARVLSLLGEVADRYPTGDMRGEALFRLFFQAWKGHRTEEARHWLETSLAKVPREDGWWEAGRTLYWLGRSAQREGKLPAAEAALVRAVREYPLSYYALVAFHRLRDGWPKTAALLQQQLYAAPSASTGRDGITKDLSWRFAPRALFATPGFRRGVELARLGLGPEARREFAALGIRPPERASKQTAAPQSSDSEELLWLAAVLYNRAGVYALAHAIPRYTLTSYALEWPMGDNRKRWLLSYPRAYADLVVENTSKNGLPEALEFAIMREESAFDPVLESFANAVGLTQLTQGAAQRFAQGLPYDRVALRDPVINLTIGARELGFLWNRYQHNPALAIAAYNAGEGAVGRWLRAAAVGDELDEFIESIPYDETRGYTKRVLASYFAYNWLYEPSNPVPTLPLQLPNKR